jgi:myo-inositol-1-phosphate synthase
VGGGPSGLSEQYEKLVRFGRSLREAAKEGPDVGSVEQTDASGEAL